MDKQALNLGVKAVIGYLAFLVGGVDRALQILITLMCLDYVTGVLAAFTGKRLDSKIGFKGIVKKVAMLALVLVAHQLDQLTGTNGIARLAVIYFLVANDGLSILENLSECGVGVPEFLKTALGSLKEKGNKGEAKG